MKALHFLWIGRGRVLQTKICFVKECPLPSISCKVIAICFDDDEVDGDDDEVDDDDEVEENCELCKRKQQRGAKDDSPTSSEQEAVKPFV